MCLEWTPFLGQRSGLWGRLLVSLGESRGPYGQSPQEELPNSIVGSVRGHESRQNWGPHLHVEWVIDLGQWQRGKGWSEAPTCPTRSACTRPWALTCGGLAVRSGGRGGRQSPGAWGSSQLQPGRGHAGGRAHCGLELGACRVVQRVLWLPGLLYLDLST